MDKDNKVFLGILVGWSSRGLLHLLMPHTYYNAVSIIGTIALLACVVMCWRSNRSGGRS